MPFVERDGSRKVNGRWSVSQFDGQEFLPEGHPDLHRLTAEIDGLLQLHERRAAALRALDDKRLSEASLDPLAPQEVKDYAMLVSVIDREIAA